MNLINKHSTRDQLIIERNAASIQSCTRIYYVCMLYIYIFLHTIIYSLFSENILL